MSDYLSSSSVMTLDRQRAALDAEAKERELLKSARPAHQLVDIGTECTVVQDFIPSNFDDLELYSGDVVVVEPLDDDDFDKLPMDYLKGVNRHLGPNNGKVGYFPISVVDVPGLDVDTVVNQFERMRSASGFLHPSAPDTARSSMVGSEYGFETRPGSSSSVQSTMSTAQGSKTFDDGSTGGGSDGGGVDGMDDEAYIQDMESRVQVGSKLGVRYEYEATKADELHLRLGDVVIVTHHPPGGWWRGAYFTESGLGKTGWFPCNFVRIEEEEQPQQSHQKPPQSSSGKKPSSAKSKSRFWQRKSKIDVGKDQPRSQTPELVERPREDNDQSLLRHYSSVPASARQSAHFEPDPVDSSNSTVSDAPNKGKQLSSANLGSQVINTLARKLTVPELKTNNTVSLDPTHLNELIQMAEVPKKPNKKSWKDNLPSEIVARMTPKEMKKQQVLWELYVTEIAYVADLKMTMEIFLQPMSDQKLLNLKNIEAIFSNIGAIFVTNYRFSKSLERLYAENDVLEFFGPTFIAAALARVKDLTQSNKAFKQFLADAYQNPATRHLDLTSYLIKPMQRLTKYPLLLMEILKNTETDHPDRKNIEISLAKVQNVLMVVNEGIDGAQKMNDIQNSFASKIKLISATRYFVREDNASVLLPPPDSRTRPRTVFMFNDMIVLSKKDWREKNHVVDTAPISRVELVEISQDPSRFMFELKFHPSPADGGDPVSYMIVMTSKEQKNAWTQAYKSLAATVDQSAFEKGVEETPVFWHEDSRQSFPKELQKKINTSQYDLARTLTGSKHSLATIDGDAASVRRQRAMSLNDSPMQHVQIAQETIETHGPLVITKAASLTDMNQSQEFGPYRESGVDIFSADGSRPDSMAFSDVGSVLSAGGYGRPNDEDNDELYMEVDRLRNDIITMTHTIDEKDDEIVNLNAQLLEGQLKVEETLNESNGLRQDKVELQQELESSKAKNDALEKENEQLKKDMAIASEKISELQAKGRSSSPMPPSSPKVDSTRSGNHRRQLSASAEVLQQQHAKPPVTPQIPQSIPTDVLQARISELEEENERLKTEKNAAVRKDSMGVEINRLNNKVVDLSQALDDERASLQELRASNQMLAEQQGKDPELFAAPRGIRGYEGGAKMVSVDSSEALQNKTATSKGVQVEQDFVLAHPLVTDLAQERDDLGERLDLLQTELTQMTSKFDSSQKTLKRAKAAYDKVKDEMRALQNSKGSEISNYQQELDEYAQKVEQLNETIANVEKKLSDKTGDFDILEKQNRTSQDANAELKIKLSQLESSIADREASIQTLTADVEGLNVKILALNAEKETLKAKAERANAEITRIIHANADKENLSEQHDQELQDQIRHFEGLASTHEKQNSALEKNIKKLEAEIERLNGLLKESQDEVADINQKFEESNRSSMNTEKSQLQELREFREKLAKKEAELISVQRRVEKIELERDIHAKTIESLEAELQSSSKESKELETLYNDLLHERKKTVNSQIRLNVEKKKESKAEMESLQAEIDNLRNANSKADLEVTEANRIRKKIETESELTIQRLRDQLENATKMNEFSLQENERLSTLEMSARETVSENQTLKAKYEQLSSTTSKLQEALKTAESQLKSNGDEKKGVSQKYERLKKEYKALKENLAKEREKLEKLEAQYTDTSIDLQSKTSEIEMLKTESSHFAKLRERFNAKTTEQLEEISTLRTQVLDLETRLAEISLESQQTKTPDITSTGFTTKIARYGVFFKQVREIANLDDHLSEDDVLKEAIKTLSDYQNLKLDTEHLMEKYQALEKANAGLSEQINFFKKLAEDRPSMPDPRSFSPSHTPSVAEDRVTELQQRLALRETEIRGLVNERDRLIVALNDAQVLVRPQNEKDFRSLESEIKRLEDLIRSAGNTSPSRQAEATDGVDYQRVVEERNSALRSLNNREEFVPTREFQEIKRQNDAFFEDLKRMQFEMRRLDAEFNGQRVKYTEMQTSVETKDQIISAKSKEISELLQCIEDYRRHQQKMEDFFTESLHNRERDLQSLRSNIDQLVHPRPTNQE